MSCSSNSPLGSETTGSDASETFAPGEMDNVSLLAALGYQSDGPRVHGATLRSYSYGQLEQEDASSFSSSICDRSLKDI